jgi:hypothetical protein
MPKFSSNGILRMLTPLHSQCRVQFSKQYFGLYKDDPATLPPRTVSDNKMWIHHCDPETEQESMQ